MLLEYIWKFLCTSGSIVTEHLAFYLYLSFFHFKRRSLEISIDVSGSIIMEHLTFFHVTGRFMDGTKMTLNILQSTTLLCHQKISRPIDWSLNGRPTSTAISMNMHFTFLTALFMCITLRRDQDQIYIDVCLFSHFSLLFESNWYF